MAEFKKGIAVAGAIAIVIALGVGVLAITVFPSGLGGSSTIANGSGPALEPVGPQLSGQVLGQNASCLLASGVCTFTVWNNSTTPLDPVDCQMLVVGSVEVTSTTLSATNESATTTFITFANGSVSTVVSPPTISSSSASETTQTFIEYVKINGTVGGTVNAAIPAGFRGTMTCAVPLAQLTQQPVGSLADGDILTKTASSWESTPAGTQILVGFEGVWS